MNSIVPYEITYEEKIQPGTTDEDIISGILNNKEIKLGIIYNTGVACIRYVSVDEKIGPVVASILGESLVNYKIGTLTGGEKDNNLHLEIWNIPRPAQYNARISNLSSEVLDILTPPDKEQTNNLI